MEVGVVVKYAKKVISIGSLLLAIMIVFSLSSCSGGNEIAEIKIKDMFTNEDKSFYLRPKQQKQYEIHDDIYTLAISPKLSLDMQPKISFDEVYNQLEGNGEYRATRYSDNIGILQSVTEGSIYCLVKTANNYYTLTNPFIKTFGYKTDSVANTSKKVSEYICFPVYFIEDVSPVVLSNDFELDKEYKITCTKDEMKKFYVDLNKFNVEDTENGFLVKGFREIPKTAYRFDAMGNYKFTFSQKDNSTVLVLSMV